VIPSFAGARINSSPLFLCGGCFFHSSWEMGALHRRGLSAKICSRANGKKEILS